MFEAIQNRRLNRPYKSTPVPNKTLEVLLEAARLSPSAKNIQPWHFIVVKDEKKRRTLSKGFIAKYLREVPVVIVLCGDERASPDWYLVDVALAGESMVLAATSEGLNTSWIGDFDETIVQDQLGIPKNLRVIALLAVGYARETESIKRRIMGFMHRRKALNEIASWEMYGNKLQGV